MTANLRGECFITTTSLERIPGALVLAVTSWLLLFAAAAPPLLHAEPPAPVAKMVPVESSVNLEVLDWGGSGRPLVFLTGLGADAHAFDGFAPQFIADHHVYAISRRGFGASSKPEPTTENYSPARLGEDVLTVIHMLKLNRPVLAGQSIAGEEMSWIGSLHPREVAGLIYLDAVDSYSFYDPADPDMAMDMADVRRQIDAFEAGEPFSPEILGSIRASAANLAASAGRMADNVTIAGLAGDPAPPRVGLAIRFAATKFTTVDAPMLAIMACPHDYSRLTRTNPKAAATLTDRDQARCMRQIQFVKSHVASAQVVNLPNADHDVVRSNEADVVRAMNAFLAELP